MNIRILFNSFMSMNIRIIFMNIRLIFMNIRLIFMDEYKAYIHERYIHG
jgi:hypothetical protein